MYKKLAKGTGQEEELWLLRASEYRLAHEAIYELPQHVEAEQEARWYRENPLVSYQPAARGRDPKAGAHVDFMNLKRVLLEDPRRFERNLKGFADAHGLLGLFFERFPAPMLPEGKDLVAPNSGLDHSTGKLKPVDPATRGKKQLSEAFRRKNGRFRTYGKNAEPVLKRGVGSRTALPHELSFKPKSLVPTFGRLGPLGISLAPETLSFKEAEQEYGLRVVLDNHEGYGVSLLPTREPISEWERELEDFPPGEDLTVENGYALGNIDARRAVAPTRGYVNEDGKIQEKWRCPTLLTALYVMLWRDVREGRSFPRCSLPDCGQYFRKGPQDRTMYCGKQHANTARQRKRRTSEAASSTDPS